MNRAYAVVARPLGLPAVRPGGRIRASRGVSARTAVPSRSAGGETSLVEAGLRMMKPEARRCSKKDLTTESLKATVAAFLCYIVRQIGMVRDPHLFGSDGRE
jgi:hypothetical protein